MTGTAPSVLGRPLWYELMTTDVAAAAAFYQAVVGWTSAPFEGAPQPYTMFYRTADQPTGGLMEKPADLNAPPFWAMYVGVSNLDADRERIERLGGRQCSPVIEVPDVGRMQMVMDPQGAAFYIYEPSSSDVGPEGPAQPGEASWHELLTTDAAAAMTFYREVFGWQEDEAMDMGPAGKYYLFRRTHGRIGGMMNEPPELANVPPNWQIYFRVPDLDAAVAKITQLGGRILHGPMEVPGGDRVVNAMDPQGAAFALHETKGA